MAEPGKRRGQAALVALAALFFVPLAVAWLWYANVDRVPPQGNAAHGELIDPARPLGEFELPTTDGAGTVSDRSLDGRWTLVFVGGAACDDACRATLWESRQVHTRLGRDAVRVQRVYLLVGAGDVDDPGYFAAEHPDMPVARIARDHPMLALFPYAGDGARTYIVDPLGNLMMSHPAGAGPQHLLDDLKRLLRVSRIG